MLEIEEKIERDKSVDPVAFKHALNMVKFNEKLNRIVCERKRKVVKISVIFDNPLLEKTASLIHKQNEINIKSLVAFPSPTFKIGDFSGSSSQLRINRN